MKLYYHVNPENLSIIANARRCGKQDRAGPQISGRAAPQSKHGFTYCFDIPLLPYEFWNVAGKSAV
jgi:hypothetical protein